MHVISTRPRGDPQSGPPEAGYSIAPFGRVCPSLAGVGSDGGGGASGGRERVGQPAGAAGVADHVDLRVRRRLDGGAARRRARPSPATGARRRSGPRRPRPPPPAGSAPGARARARARRRRGPASPRGPRVRAWQRERHRRLAAAVDHHGAVERRRRPGATAAGRRGRARRRPASAAPVAHTSTSASTGLGHGRAGADARRPRPRPRRSTSRGAPRGRRRPARRAPAGRRAGRSPPGSSTWWPRSASRRAHSRPAGPPPATTIAPRWVGRGAARARPRGPPRGSPRTAPAGCGRSHRCSGTGTCTAGSGGARRRRSFRGRSGSAMSGRPMAITSAAPSASACSAASGVNAAHRDHRDAELPPHPGGVGEQRAGLVRRVPVGDAGGHHRLAVGGDVDRVEPRLDAEAHRHQRIVDPLPGVAVGLERADARPQREVRRRRGAARRGSTSVNSSARAAGEPPHRSDAEVAVRRQEGVEQVAVPGVQLDGVEAGRLHRAPPRPRTGRPPTPGRRRWPPAPGRRRRRRERRHDVGRLLGGEHPRRARRGRAGASSSARAAAGPRRCRGGCWCRRARAGRR